MRGSDGKHNLHKIGPDIADLTCYRLKNSCAKYSDSGIDLNGQLAAEQAENWLSERSITSSMELNELHPCSPCRSDFVLATK